MDNLQNILNLYQYTSLMSERKKYPHSSIPGWNEFAGQVETWVLEDRTTSHDNLREKIKNYALNYLTINPGLFPMDKDKESSQLKQPQVRPLFTSTLHPL